MRVILSHENQDFDSLASMLGAGKLYPKAIPVLPQRSNRNVLDFLMLYWDELPFVRASDLPRRRRIRHAILVDTQSAIQIRGMRQDTQIQIIDHHEPAREFPEGTEYRGGNTGATTTLLVEEIIQRGIALSRVEATLLLLGIYEDTGSLSYPSTTSRDLHSAAWLLEQGANLQVVGDFLHRPLTEGQRWLYDALLDHAETHRLAGHSVMITSARAPDYVEEISTLAHKLRDLFDPDALFLLVQLDGRVQLVARSTTDAIDVGEVAESFGGGGHDKAAAALIQNGDIDQIRHRLLRVLPEFVKPSVTVGHIMSHGVVHTLSPQTTVAEASETMTRYGHEGFPVVEDGQLSGVVTRREIDTARHHGLYDVPIETYMHKGAISVSRNDSVEHLQQVMIEHGLGQVPVVEEGEIIGIVTRTDLIKAWSTPPGPTRAVHLADRLENTLPDRLLQLIRKASRAATEMGFSLYIVGGFVRDLLLGVPASPDVDLVVEGDAVALAKHLAQREGGRVHSHARFGTAKWMVGRGLALDLVTARTEFYTYPTALPSVERGSIKLDLHRRDFTINTMAICLDEDNFGQLLDFYGGQQDLERGLIRVLHSLSFIEDPTRILRAARLEQRLGFQIEARTEELIDDALELLDRVSGERIRNELDLLFQEQSPEKGLIRLDELGVLTQIHPRLHCDGWLVGKSQTLPRALSAWQELARHSAGAPAGNQHTGESTGQPGPVPNLYLALLIFRLDPPDIKTLIRRLKIPNERAKLLREVPALRPLIRSLMERDLTPSSIHRLLEPYSEEALFLLWLAADDPRVRDHVQLYQVQLRHVRTEVDGKALKALGVPPGPIYRQVLEQVRDARLDGQVSSRAEEEALVQQILAEQGYKK